MNDVKTYVIDRDTIGAYGRHYRRFQEYVSETEAIFNTVMTIIKNDNTTMSVYEINGLMPEKKADVMDIGTLVYQKRGRKGEVVYDRRKETEAAAAGGDAREAEAPEEPVMSEWRVSSNYYDGEKEYKVYRLRDVNATDHSGNRELYDTTIYKTRAEAKAVADALNAGKNPEEATVEENSTVDAKQEAQSTVDTEEEADELDAMPDVLPDPKIDAAIDQQKGNERAIKSHLLNNLQDKLHKLGYRDIFLYLNAKATTVKVFYERDEAQQTFDVTGLAPSAVGHEAWQRINDHLKRLRWAGKIA